MTVSSPARWLVVARRALYRFQWVICLDQASAKNYASNVTLPV